MAGKALEILQQIEEKQMMDRADLRKAGEDAIKFVREYLMQNLSNLSPEHQEVIQKLHGEKATTTKTKTAA
ncbi:unnamed protein product [marine sediment metagenome]|uniref:Uncharacterized protein n=1 Tax=marine sediment metagenome TaxID=412755 RepID=X0TSD9_9ZZZZ